MKFLETPLWAFLSLIIIAWITQRITSAWERKKKIEETRLDLFMTWQPFLAELYASVIFPDEASLSKRDFLKQKMEILGTIQLLGTEHGMQSALVFFDLAAKGLRKDPSFDPKLFHTSYTELNYQFCCEIHNEKKK